MVQWHCIDLLNDMVRQLLSLIMQTGTIGIEMRHCAALKEQLLGVRSQKGGCALSMVPPVQGSYESW